MEPKQGTRVLIALELEDADHDRRIVSAARALIPAGASVHLVHVHRIRQTAVFDVTYIEPPEHLAREVEQASSRLEALAAPDGTSEVLVGSPPEVLLAQTASAAMLVIGRTHLGALTRLLGGSVESRLAHESKCPVLIVP